MSATTMFAATTAVACLTTGLITTPVSAQTQTQKQITAGCVNKKTNELRVLLKSSKKCKKGWQKITFNQPGATGAPGAAGAAGPVSVVSVKDATGAVIGQSFNALDPWLTGSVLVYADGAAYSYNLGSGKVVSESWDSVMYLDASCSPSNAAVGISNSSRYLASLTSFGRMVDRPNSDLPTRAFKGTSTVRAILPSEKFWYLDNSGGCTGPFTSWNETLAMLTPVAAPPDRPGPLRIG